jgi:hypothetical protein
MSMAYQAKPKYCTEETGGFSVIGRMESLKKPVG